MIRNLKMLGLALVAVFAMSGVAASAALAEAGQGEFTAASVVNPLIVTGTTAAGQVEKLAAFNQNLECAGLHTIGEVGVTPHKIKNNGLTTLTIQSHYSKCSGKIGETVAPVTVTTNKCDFVIHLGKTIGTGPRYAVTADVVCEGEGEAIEVHAYTSSAHTTTICTDKVPPQTGLSGGFLENIAGGKVTLGGTFTGIKVTKTGILCGGTAETKTGEETVDAEAVAETEAKEVIAISISEL